MTLFNDYILVIPSIRAQSTLIHGTIGKSTHLRCSATAPFDTTLYWRRIDNNNVSSQPARFRQQQHIHGDLLHTTLYIKDLEKEDFGIYACFAESKAGRNKAIIELKGKNTNKSDINKFFCFFLNKEHHRLTTTATLPISIISQISDKDELLTTTTSRIQLLKRNKSKIKDFNIQTYFIFVTFSF